MQRVLSQRLVGGTFNYAHFGLIGVACLDELGMVSVTAEERSGGRAEVRVSRFSILLRMSGRGHRRSSRNEWIVDKVVSFCYQSHRVIVLFCSGSPVPRRDCRGGAARARAPREETPHVPPADAVRGSGDPGGGGVHGELWIRERWSQKFSQSVRELG